MRFVLTILVRSLARFKLIPSRVEWMELPLGSPCGGGGLHFPKDWRYRLLLSEGLRAASKGKHVAGPIAFS
jgi:hypothetical protein